jgi:hypothetical protein
MFPFPHFTSVETEAQMGKPFPLICKENLVTPAHCQLYAEETQRLVKSSHFLV